VGVGASYGSHYSRKALPPGNLLGMLLSTDHVAVQRGLAEFRGGRPVLFLATEPFIALPVDGSDQLLFEELRRMFNTAPVQLVITAQDLPAA
jgi:hypothetical protein